MNAKPKLSCQAKRTLAAVETLLKYYRGGYKDEYLADCPLCDATPCDCGVCPWEMFEGGWCGTRIRGLCEKRLHPKSGWRVASIKRLTRWTRLIKNGTYDKRLAEAKP